jgi:hypothetical protein
MKQPNYIPFIILCLMILVMILFLTKKKDEEKPINVRSYKRTITVKGHTKRKPKSKKKKR